MWCGGLCSVKKIVRNDWITKIIIFLIIRNRKLVLESEIPNKFLSLLQFEREKKNSDNQFRKLRGITMIQPKSRVLYVIFRKIIKDEQKRFLHHFVPPQ